MINVCGVTFDHTINYGSCLQAYALQTAVERIKIAGEGCQYELIPLLTIPEHPNYQYGITQAIWPRRIYKRCFWTICRKKFTEFETRYLKFADCRHFDDLPALNLRKDVFVCGSDVIWNPAFSLGMGAYYLDFAKKYKFSYAASFGSSEIDEMPDKTAKWLGELNEISVREKGSEAIAKSLVEREIHIVVDPMLLLDRKDWDALAGEKKDCGKFIFSYTTHHFPMYDRFLQELSAKTGLPVKKTTISYEPKELLKEGIPVLMSPQEWVRQIRDAEYVVTNSFHATALAVLFHKKFFTFVYGEKAKGINMRMNDFLISLGLEDRLHDSIPDVFDLGEVDFTNSDKTLEISRRDSLAFLQRNLERAREEKIKCTF